MKVSEVLVGAAVIGGLAAVIYGVTRSKAAPPAGTGSINLTAPDTADVTIEGVIAHPGLITGLDPGIYHWATTPKTGVTGIGGDTGTVTVVAGQVTQLAATVHTITPAGQNLTISNETAGYVVDGAWWYLSYNATVTNNNNVSVTRTFSEFYGYPTGGYQTRFAPVTITLGPGQSTTLDYPAMGPTGRPEIALAMSSTCKIWVKDDLGNESPGAIMAR
jgi:hypothetical protein